LSIFLNKKIHEEEEEEEEMDFRRYSLFQVKENKGQ